MTTHHALRDFETLPPDAQQQVIDFIAFIKLRYQARKSINNGLEAASAFGAIKVKKSVSLDGMEQAIQQKGSEF